MAITDAKENRKTRYTKMVIRDSLLELMKDKSILSISIKEICDRADISRSTFYVYYKDQYELLKQIEDKMEDETLEKMSGMVDKVKNPSKYTKRYYIEMLEKWLQFIADNKTSAQVLLGVNGNPAFQKKFLRHFTERVQNLIPKNSENSINAVRLDYYSNFAVGGFLAIIQTWLNNDMNLNVPELAKMTFQLFGTGIFKEL
jgi:AcrR family transcriptional regulator